MQIEYNGKKCGGSEFQIPDKVKDQNFVVCNNCSSKVKYFAVKEYAYNHGLKGTNLILLWSREKTVDYAGTRIII